LFTKYITWLLDWTKTKNEGEAISFSNNVNAILREEWWLDSLVEETTLITF
jgi:hypothetical protein